MFYTDRDQNTRLGKRHETCMCVRKVRKVRKVEQDILAMGERKRAACLGLPTGMDQPPGWRFGHELSGGQRRDQWRGKGGGDLTNV